jgi:hypothetical protein
VIDDCQDTHTHDNVVPAGSLKMVPEESRANMIGSQQDAEAAYTTLSPLLKGNRIKMGINTAKSRFDQIVDLFLNIHNLAS